MQSCLFQYMYCTVQSGGHGGRGALEGHARLARHRARSAARWGGRPPPSSPPTKKFPVRFRLPEVLAQLHNLVVLLILLRSPITVPLYAKQGHLRRSLVTWRRAHYFIQNNATTTPRKSAPKTMNLMRGSSWHFSLLSLQSTIITNPLGNCAD